MVYTYKYIYIYEQFFFVFYKDVTANYVTDNDDINKILSTCN